MSVDERLRVELERSFAPGPVDVEPELTQVRSVHAHARRRAHVLRQLTSGVILVVMLAGAGAFAVWRGAPVHYTSTSAVKFDTTVTDDQANLALAPSTRAVALRLSGLLPGDSRVSFSASVAQRSLSLAVTAPTSSQATLVAEKWANAFVHARRVDDETKTRADRAALRKRVMELHDRLRAVDLELAKLDPFRFNRIDLAPFGECAFDSGRCSVRPQPWPPRLPANAPRRELHLVEEHTQILGQITSITTPWAQLRMRALPVLVRVAPTTAKEVAQTPSTGSALGIAAAGLLALLAAAYVIYRFRMRPCPNA